MSALESLSLGMGLAWTSGLNLYATIVILGLGSRMGMIVLPPDLQILAHPLVIGVASVMYVIEFFADKIPYVDNGWDLLHTFIRIPAGAVLAARSVAHVDPALELAAFLAGGAAALTSHGAKATLRLAINASPEPFSNWVASITEDVTVLGGTWLAFNHPLLMLVWVVCFTIFAVWLIRKLYGFAKRGLAGLKARFQRTKTAGKDALTGPPGG